jgi:hypothetical protein
VWGQDLRSLSFPHLHVPCGFDLVLGQFSVRSDLRAPSFSSLARMFPCGFDHVFWNQFSVGSDLLPFLFLTCMFL